MKRVMWLIPAILGFVFCVTRAQAQEVPAWEVAGGYSYLRVNVKSPSYGLNGGFGSLTENVNGWFGGRIEVGAFSGTESAHQRVGPDDHIRACFFYAQISKNNAVCRTAIGRDPWQRRRSSNFSGRIQICHGSCCWRRSEDQRPGCRASPRRLLAARSSGTAAGQLGRIDRTGPTSPKKTAKGVRVCGSQPQALSRAPYSHALCSRASFTALCSRAITRHRLSLKFP